MGSKSGKRLSPKHRARRRSVRARRKKWMVERARKTLIAVPAGYEGIHRAVWFSLRNLLAESCHHKGLLRLQHIYYKTTHATGLEITMGLYRDHSPKSPYIT